MIEVVRFAFRRSLEVVAAELDVMPLSLLNESVFRFFFCRAVQRHDRQIQQLVECDRIDLVLRAPEESAFLEFKFYQRRRRFDPYTAKRLGFKGGPGQQNLREFQTCVDGLHQRPYIRGLSKFIVLVYADFKEGNRLTFFRSFDNYHHANADVPLRLVESHGPLQTSDEVVRASLYALTPT